MTSKKQKNDGFPIPDPIAGYDEFVCYQVRVPNVREYRTAFVGHVRQLEKWWNWDKTYLDGDTRAKEAAAYWVQLLEFLEPDNCEVDLLDIRQDPDRPCIIQKTADGTTWVDTVDMQLCPPRIRVNNGVIQWQDDDGVWHDLDSGDERVDGTAPIFYPSDPDGACLQAENITAIYQTVLTELRAGVVASKAAVAIAATITGIMGIFIAPALIGTLSLVITGIALDVGESALDTMLGSTHLDNFKCQIFCNIEDDGSITAEDFTNLRSGMATWASGAELELIQFYLDSFGSVGLQRQGVAGGITTGDCEDCDCPEPPVDEFGWHIFVEGSEDDSPNRTPYHISAFGGSFSQPYGFHVTANDFTQQSGTITDFGSGSTYHLVSIVSVDLPSAPVGTTTIRAKRTSSAASNQHIGKTFLRHTGGGWSDSQDFIATIASVGVEEDIVVLDWSAFTDAATIEKVVIDFGSYPFIEIVSITYDPLDI